MSKKELVTALVEKTGLKKKDAQAAIEALFGNSKSRGIIVDAVAKGNKIRLTGFGAFYSVKRKERTARNPQNGGTIKVPAKVVPKFKAGSTFVSALK